MNPDIARQIKAQLAEPKKGVKLPRAESEGEEALARDLRLAGIKFQREFRFAPPRRWKFDFVLGVEHGCIALEVDGGTASGKSRHSYGAGYERDAEKLNAAARMGWKVLRFTTRQGNVRRGDSGHQGGAMMPSLWIWPHIAMECWLDHVREATKKVEQRLFFARLHKETLRVCALNVRGGI